MLSPLGLVLTLVLLLAALLAAGIHVMIFVLESVRWMAPSTRRTFGIRSEEEAETTRALAFNQGFYNLFLALGVVLGLVLVFTGPSAAGFALLFFALGSMLAASIVLVASRPTLLRAALIQGVAPAVGILAAIPFAAFG